MPFLWLYHEKFIKIQINPFVHVGVRTNPDSKAFQNSLSSPLSIHKIRSFWPSCGGGVFRNGKRRFFNSFFFRFRPIFRMWCLFHGHSEEKAPFPCDDKLPPAKMSAYRCHFYGYIVGNGPKYELTRTSLGGVHNRIFRNCRTFYALSSNA